ncbi:MAG TPA: C25 family cysteine peptidase [Anaerolineae bacterium]|nr:C25 family cysteine peptidase [Anaerolineae bacterium]
MTPSLRLTKRTARWLAAGCVVLALAAIGLAVWLNRSVTVAMPPSDARVVKLLVADEGIVSVRPADVGWGGVDPATVQVKYDGNALPVWIDNDQLRFYAPISPTRYMSETVFWLERSDQASPRISEQPIAARGDLGSIDHYTATLHLEENPIYSPQVASGDHWFWAQLPAPITKTVPFTLTALADGAAEVTIEVWSNTEAPTPIDHDYRLAVNDHPLGDFTWDGQGWHTIEAAIPPGVLHEGGNILTLILPGVKDVVADITDLNWIEVHYPRAFVAQDDRLAFDSSGGLQRLTGFSGPIAVFDVTQPDRVTRIPLQDGASFVGEAGHRYWVVGPRGYRSGQAEAAQLTPDLHDAQNAAAYLAIGPIDLLEPLKPLLDWRTTQGLATMAVPVQAIYDQFGDGRVDPEAIRSFLKYATQHWTVKPQYVLLVGDASYDTLDYTAPPEANRVPTFLVQTVYGGETASDVGFAQLDDDEKPDVAIGRAPARDAEQVRAFVAKTIAYEKSAPPGEWRSRVLAVADGQEAAFHDEAQHFLDQFTGYQTNLVSPPAGATQTNEEIVRDLNEGRAIVGYFGHGSVTQWGKDNLFTVKDVATLQNSEHLPLIINMTCLTGLFTHPKVQSLSETLLWQPDGGAVAILAPTSLTLSSDQSFLSNALVQGLMKDRTARLGDVFLQAQRAVSSQGANTQDVLRTFLLFGDPALRLVQP